MRITETHIYFWGSYLSNFAFAPFKSEIPTLSEPVVFITSEHYFMAVKALTFGDRETLLKIIDLKTTDTGKKAKALGRTVKYFDPEKWNKVCDQFMFDACFKKFSEPSNANVKYDLLDTGNRILVEASPWDKIWGVGLHEDDDLILDEKNWLGQNRLGKALMKVRDELRNAE